MPSLRPIRRFALLCLVGIVGIAHAWQQRLEGHIVSAHDGDTITLLDAEHRQHRIRLDGIDAPELRQPFGQAAKQNLAELVAGREVIAECHKTDRYGRDVCSVLIEGTDAGLEQLRVGMAWFFTRYATELSPERRAKYSATEAEARTERRGLWTSLEPVAPWEWRAGRKPTAAPAP